MQKTKSRKIDAEQIKQENLTKRRSLIETMRQHGRSFERRDVCLPANMEVRLPGGKLFDTGRTLVKDISLAGALLTRIRMKKRVLPTRLFRVHLSFIGSKYTGIHAVCIPLRFGKGPDFEIGVEFEDLWAQV